MATTARPAKPSQPASNRSRAQQGKPHKSGGQGRVTNPSTDGRLKRNRGTSR